jgi:hypothetical protein
VWPELRTASITKVVADTRYDPDASIDPAATRELVELALDEGSKEVKVAAIECLGSAKTDLPVLLEQAKAKAKEVRKAAITALARVDDSQATQALRTAFQGNDIEHVIAPIQSTPNTEIVSFVLETTRAELNTLLAGKEKDKPAADSHAFASSEVCGIEMTSPLKVPVIAFGLTCLCRSKLILVEKTLMHNLFP